MLYALDLETYTGDGGGLDPTVASTRITSAAIFCDDGAVVFDDLDEARLLRALNAWFADPATSSGTIVTWNGANFDLPFLLTRAAHCGVELDLRAEVHETRKPKYSTCPGHDGGYVASWGPHDHVDLMYAYRAYADEHGLRCGLKPMARHFGHNPIEVSRTDMEALTVAERCAYNVSDVEVTYHLAARIDITDWLDSRAK